ncbi:MAG: beta-ketoacyl synthase N-terminal-like domain-containing protein [Nitrosomonas sp.]
MRVVVTGMGIISPIGTGADQFWNAAIQGVSGISNIQCFDASGQYSRIAGQINGFDLSSFFIRKTDRSD